MSKKLFFNFYGIGVEVSSSWDEVLGRLKRDFSYFLKEDIKEGTFPIELRLEISKKCITPKDTKEFHYKSSKVSFYEKTGQRYCNYFNKVESEINFKDHTALIRGEDLHAIHEVSYLMILSRVGKALDQMGVHRLHAGAFEKDGVLFLALFSSGGGKSTLLNSIMAGDGYTFFSDDSPLVSEDGKVLPFPIRIGFSEGSVPEALREVPSYTLKRFRYGAKILFGLNDLNWPIGSDYKKIILISGQKGNVASYRKEFGLWHLFHIIKEGVIGIGLPILYEYFWEYGIGDFWVKTKIAIKRFRTLFYLWLKAKKYQVTLESDLDKNKIMIENLIKEERN